MSLQINLKDIITCILILAIINLITGCYSFRSATLSEYKQFEKEEGKPKEIYVKTKDNLWYHFTNFNYRIESDTLYGWGKILLEDWEEPSSINIPISNIESLGIEKKDMVRTYFAYAGIVLAVIGIIAFSYIMVHIWNPSELR